MTAFDTAWDIVKMPLLPNSLKEREGGYTGKFQDPKTDEILPLYIHGDIDEGVLVGSIPKRARAEISSWLPDIWVADDVATREQFQSRGYMSAIYDAIATILNRNDAELRPSPVQTPEGSHFWGGREEWKGRDDQ